MRVLRHLQAVTMNGDRDIINDACICIEQDRIAAVCTSEDIPQSFRKSEQVDCSGLTATPGMVNTHTHLFQTLLKGLGDDMVLKEWFACMTGPSALHLTARDMNIASRFGCVESLLGGVTTLVDFQYVNTDPAMIDACFEGVAETGIRGFVCRGFMTRGEEFGVPGGLIENIDDVVAHTRAAARRHNSPGGRVQIGIAPCMYWTVGSDAYRAVRQLADEENLLITTHLSETDFEIERASVEHGMSDTQMLADLGFLGPDVLAVHCVKCETADIHLLHEHKVKVSHNPCSNLYLGSGIARIPEMLAAGLTVSLGSDGPASSNNHSLIQAMKFAALVPKGIHADPTIMTAEKVLEMATIDGATAIGLGDEIGSLEVGKKADIALFDLTRSASTAPLHNAPSALVYSALGNEAVTVLVDGEFVVRDRQILTQDFPALQLEAQSAADSLCRRAGSSALKNRPWPRSHT